MIFGEPRVVSLFALSGAHGEMPTNNALHEQVWTIVHRLFKRGEDKTWSGEDPPYVLKIAPRGPYYDAVEVPRDDDPVKLASNAVGPVIVLDVTKEAWEEQCWDDKAYKACTLYKSTAKKEKKTLQLGDCLSKAFEREQLGEDDKWYCPKCKDHRTAFKKFDMWRLPNVLVVHLKRFQYRAGYMNFVSRSKIDCQVDFPEVLDVAEYCKGPIDADGSVYTLYAVSNHMGGLGGGHYTAYAKNFRDDEWYSFDDSSVSRASVDRVATPYAYVLFYLRTPGVKAEKPVETADGASAEEPASGAGTA